MKNGRPKIVLLGPPGAGKGTQAALLASQLGVPAISTGDMLRLAVASGSELGGRVQGIMASGALVDDATMADVVRDRLDQDDARQGFLLDGYPRTLQQVQTLDDHLAETNRPIDAVISLLADTDEVVARLLRRAEIDGRADDNEETIRVRLQVYADQTAPLLEVYRSRGLLVEVNGLGEIDEVSDRVFAALDAQGKPETRELVEPQ